VSFGGGAGGGVVAGSAKISRLGILTHHLCVAYVLESAAESLRTRQRGDVPTVCVQRGVKRSAGAGKTRLLTPVRIKEQSR